MKNVLLAIVCGVWGMFLADLQAAPAPTVLTPATNPVLGFVNQQVSVGVILKRKSDGHPLANRQIEFLQGSHLLGTATTDRHGLATFAVAVSTYGDTPIHARFNRANTGSYGRSTTQVVVRGLLSRITCSGWRVVSYPAPSQVADLFITCSVDQIDPNGQVLGPVSQADFVAGVRVPISGPNNDGGSSIGKTDNAGHGTVTVRLRKSVLGQEANLFGWHVQLMPDGAHILTEDTRRIRLR